MDLARTGRVLTYRGSFGPAADEFYNPWSVFITRAGNIWIGAAYNDRIQAYRYATTPAAQSSWGRLKARFR